MIEERFGPGIGHIFGSKKIMDVIKILINEKFPDIFMHELEYFSQK
jgi:hypothetical protein